MVNACPVQADPRLNVFDFVSNDSIRAMSGLVTEGLIPMMDVLEEELKKQEPESLTVRIDRDLLADEDICFSRELSAFIDGKLASGRKLNLIIVDDIPVVGWNVLMENYRGSGVQVYYGTLACRQVPLCTKLL